MEAVRAAFSAWGPEQDLDSAFDAGFHPDVEYREDPDWPGAATYCGIDAVKAFQAYLEPRTAFAAAGMEEPAS